MTQPMSEPELGASFRIEQARHSGRRWLNGGLHSERPEDREGLAVVVAVDNVAGATLWPLHVKPVRHTNRACHLRWFCMRAGGGVGPWMTPHAEAESARLA